MSEELSWKDFDLGEFDGDEAKKASGAGRREEISDLWKKLKAAAKAERDRFVEITDSEYWVALCFQTREQKEEFLQKLGLLELGDKYLDGLEVAKKLKVKIESGTPPIRKTRVNKRWLEFTK
jgi:hypothetical protein